jgi:diguanylate cyclase (GGDEF)-like protein
MLARNAELHQANEVLEQLAITDGLTRIHNHRFFQDQLTREVKRADRTGAPLALLVIDLDDFKRFNDEYGHETGDEVLQRVAEVLVEETRDADLVARYGGEEFVVLASDTDLEGAAALAEKLRLAVHLRPLALSTGGASARVTVSIGVAQYSGDRSRLFRDADRALYEAKAAGKDCVVVAAPGDGPGKHDRGPTIRNT